MNLWEWFRQEFDKILLTILWGVSVWVCIHSMHHSADSSSVSWAQTLVAGWGSAMLTLITQKIVRRQDDEKK